MSPHAPARLAAIMLEQEILEILATHFRLQYGHNPKSIELGVEEAPDGSQHFTALAEFE